MKSASSFGTRNKVHETNKENKPTGAFGAGKRKGMVLTIVNKT
jgi:hypothetical protein